MNKFAVDSRHLSRPGFALVKVASVKIALVEEQVSWLWVKEGPWAVVSEGKSPS